MKIYIKNMVCHRCELAVESILQKLGLHPTVVNLGEIQILEEDISSVKDALREELQAFGFEILDDRRNRTIEQIKNLITDLVHQKNNQLEINLSEYLTRELHQDYSSLSHLFSEVEGTTIEKFYILQKTEKVKELLVYDEMSISEIADLLGYSSVAYLSNQFKKMTGLTPSHFKNVGIARRKSLDKI